MSNTAVQFENTFLHSQIEVGPASVPHPSEVMLIEGEHTSIVSVRAGGVTLYMNVATARSLASQILSVTDNGCDPLWETEPATGEEVDRWVEDIRTGAIGGKLQ